MNYTTVPGARVGVLMGSASDWSTMKRTAETLTELGVTHECNAISAHRNPDRVMHYCRHAPDRGIRVLICAAGGAAHLAGVVAAHSPLPVLACPIAAWSLDGLDSLLSMVQMPKGVPVATFAIGNAGAINAALFAVQILAGTDEALHARWLAFRAAQSAAVQTLPAS
ncbi:MAG: 5-(carboxyamino)imidazole ribonucleotide mutase [Phycisphaerales bacterium]|nr:5-(carboxyamino)imidazole ribonucleotide mutase [Phycisphaerales bacterium]